MDQHAIETRRFDSPDERLDMKERGGISIVKMADGSAGMHAIFEPGWTWEADEKPLLGSPDSCPMRHTGYCMSGKLVVPHDRHGARDETGGGRFLRDPAGSRRPCRRYQTGRADPVRAARAPALN